MVTLVKQWSISILAIIVLAGCACVQPAPEYVCSFAHSSDGVPIAYTVYGNADADEPALVFVHGWSCDSRYWREQVPFFADDYQVVTIDLAGHGHSGQGRTDYTVAAFSDDITAVVEQLDLARVILIGHSMSGPICAAAAVHMPERVIGVIGVDTLQNVESRFSEEEYNGMIGGLKENFAVSAAQFVRSMFRDGADPAVVEWVVADTSSAPPAIAVSTITNYFDMFQRGEMAAMFEQVSVPVRAVNADLWPMDPEANLRHMRSFEYVIMPNTGHFLMLEKPREFNELLEEAISNVL